MCIRVGCPEFGPAVYAGRAPICFDDSDLAGEKDWLNPQRIRVYILNQLELMREIAKHIIPPFS